jgi:hypothetical protein
MLAKEYVPNKPNLFGLINIFKRAIHELPHCGNPLAVGRHVLWRFLNL